MKTIYNVRALCVVALLGATATMNAQEDASKDKNLNREMTLERDYDPTVQDANKVNTLPVVKEPEVKKMSIDYADFTVATEPNKEISLLPSGNIMTEMNYNKRRGYFNFGGGTNLNLNGDLGYHILSTDKDQLRFNFSHRSTNGNVKYMQEGIPEGEEKVKAKLNDNIGALDFRHVFTRAAFNMGLKYGYSAYNYFGLPLSGGTPLEDFSVADRETNQVDQTIQGHVGINSVDEGAPLGYMIDLGLTNFSHKYGLSEAFDGLKENTFKVGFNFFSSFLGSNSLGVAGDLRYYGYSIPSEYNLEATTSPVATYDNHFNGVLNPYFRTEGDGWYVKIGAKVMLVAGYWDKCKFHASPDVDINVKVADKTVFYAKAGGELRGNSMYDLSRACRYANPLEAVSPSFNWLDAKIGLQSGVAPGFWFDVFGGYSITSNDHYFMAYNNLNNYANMFNYVSMRDDINSKQLFLGANLKYSYQKLFDINLKGVYNNWKMELGDSYDGAGDDSIDPIGKPVMEINAGVTVHPLAKLSASLDYYLATGRKAEVFGVTQDMNNINELNLTGAYNFNDTFGLYLKLCNVLCQKYELFYGYPMQSFSAMVGVNINF